jgi:hypothetical protein
MHATTHRLHLWRPNILDALAIYRPRMGASLLVPLRPFAETEEYGWLAFSMPDTRNASVPDRGSIEDQTSVPPLSFLLMLSGASDQAAGFRFQIEDKGTRQPIASAHMRFAASTNPAPGVGVRPLPYILPAPYAVAYPGLLTIKVTNLATVANNLQLVLWFAVPKRR